MQDQYINHIMNETGVTVMLKGCGSGSFEPQGEGTIVCMRCLIFSSLLIFTVEKFDKIY